MTQREQLLSYLQKNGSITLIDAIAMLGITDLQKVVSKARKRYGFDIIRTGTHRYKTLSGKWTNQPEYHLTEKGDAKLTKKSFPAWINSMPSTTIQNKQI